MELWDLVSALARVLRTSTPETHANIRYDDTPISVYVERIGEQVRREKRVAFSSLFAGGKRTQPNRGRVFGDSGTAPAPRLSGGTTPRLPRNLGHATG